MNSLLCYVWAVMMSLTVAVGMLPSAALCHLGAALRTGAGTLTKIAFGDHIIYCTFTKSDGSKHPMLLSHVRVSREPQPRIALQDDFDSGDALFKSPSPSFQHKMLQFHSNGYSGQSHYPTKLIVSEYPSIKSLPVYPVASKYGKVGSTFVVKNPLQGGDDFEDSSDENDSWEFGGNKWEPNLLPEPKDPTFTPFIGARALNIPEFFEHLRENLNALAKGRVKQQENLEVLGSTGGNADDVDKSEVQDIEKIAAPTRRGYSPKSDPIVAQSVQRPVEENGGEFTNRDLRSATNSFVLANRFFNQKTTRSVGGNDEPPLDEKTKELLHFLGHGKPEYPKANKYNPAWLFTNLGLGKRNWDYSR